MWPESGFWIAPSWSQIGKITITSQFGNMKPLSIFFWHCFVSLVRFSYWSKFHVNIITGSGVMTVLFYKGLTRNPEIRITLISVFPNIWRLGSVRDTKFCTNVSNGMDVVKCQGYSFYHFWVIKGKPTVWSKITPPPTQIKVKAIKYSIQHLHVQNQQKRHPNKMSNIIKVKNKDARTTSGNSIVNFEHILHFILLLSLLNK